MADADRLAVLHADARVMNLLQHGVLTRTQSDSMVATYEAEWPALGFGSWTATERDTGRLVGVNILATVRAALGSLDRVERLVKSLGLVNSSPDFLDHPYVLNGFSELLVRMIPLLFTAVAVALPARIGLINVGGEGQLYMGAWLTTAGALAFADWPAIGIENG